MDGRTLTAREVEAWLVAVDRDLAVVSEKLAPLSAEKQRLEDRRALLQGLLRSFDGPAANGSPPIPPARSGSIARYVVDNAVEILREEGRPMHINDLHERFVERGLSVPGAGKPVNLTVHLRSAAEIASPTRGVYGLVEQVGAVHPARQARKRKSARRRVRERKS
jgi:hypothetical protein